MKTYKLRFETDPEIPPFKRLHYEEVEVPFKDIIQRGIHPNSMNQEASGREVVSLRNRLYEVLNDDVHTLPHLARIGYGEEMKESMFYYDRYDLTSNFARIAKQIRFVDNLDYPQLVELATSRLREIWKHETARDLAQAVYPDFNDLRDFLKGKSPGIKLSGYKDIENHDLATIISIDDFEGQDKAIIALAIEWPNFRKTSFLSDIITDDGYLSLTKRFDWFGLEIKKEEEHSDQALIVLCEVEGDQVHLMPDTDADARKRDKAEAFARRWSNGTGKYCFTVSLDTIEQMLEEPDITITFDGFRYDDKNASRNEASLCIRGPTIGRFSVQRYPIESSTNEFIKEILTDYGVSMTGRKEALIEKLVKLATERYNALAPVLDRFFSDHTYIKVPQPERDKGKPFPVLADSPLDQLILGIYIVRHLRGNVVLDAACENPAVGIVDTAQALIDKKIDLDCDFIAVEQHKTMEVKP